MNPNEFSILRCPVCREMVVTNCHPATHVHGRTVTLVPHEPVLAPESIAVLEAAVERIVPWLEKRDWRPMTTMLIRSVLSSAALLRCRLRASSAEDPEKAAALEAQLAELVRTFEARPPESAPEPPAPPALPYSRQ